MSARTARGQCLLAGCQNCGSTPPRVKVVCKPAGPGDPAQPGGCEGLKIQVTKETIIFIGRADAFPRQIIQMVHDNAIINIPRGRMIVACSSYARFKRGDASVQHQETCIRFVGNPASMRSIYLNPVYPRLFIVYVVWCLSGVERKKGMHCKNAIRKAQFKIRRKSQTTHSWHAPSRIHLIQSPALLSRRIFFFWDDLHVCTILHGRIFLQRNALHS